MASGRVSVGCWASLLVLANVAREGYTGDGGGGGGAAAGGPSTAPSSVPVPDIYAVYTVLRAFPGRSDIACITQDSPDDLFSRLVPPHLANPTFLKSRMSWALKIKWLWDVEGPLARGALCMSSSAPLYPVSFPLLSCRARLVPEYLSYTISAGEDLHVRLRGAKPRGSVWWQKEPVQPAGWKQATLTHEGALLVPATMLSGSGFYSVVNESGVHDTSIVGTFSLVVRDCPTLRYGEDCRGWCPDCMYGGICHPLTGECVCPDGVTGRFCENRCERNVTGRDCTVPTWNIPGKLVCRPLPMPCRCIRGYTGARCVTECAAGTWGVDCAQHCRPRCLGNCDGQTGECDAAGASLCAGGDAGLPRIRRAPKVTGIGAEEVTIEFSEWREGYDDGNATLWDSLTHVVKLKTSNVTEDIVASGPRQTLTNLTAATHYEVQVVVLVAASQGGLNVTCMAEGTSRERVHTVSFTTLCPEEIPVPDIIDIARTSDTSILVRWKPVPYPRGCHLEYHLSVTREEPGEASGDSDTQNVTLTETQTVVNGLEARVRYSVSVFARNAFSSSSAASSTTLQIYKKSVGHLETAAAVSVVVLLTVVVTVVLWRKTRRRRSRSGGRQPSATTVVAVSSEGANPATGPREGTTVGA